MSMSHLTLLLAAASLGAAQDHGPAPATGGLMRMEMKLLQARLRRDFDFISAVYAGDILIIEDGVVRGKTERLAEVRKRGEYSVAISDLRLRAWGDVGVVVGRFTSRGTARDGPAALTGWFTDVWLERDRWRLVSEEVAYDKAKPGGEQP